MVSANIFEIIRHGGMAMYPLGLASILSVAIILERLWAIRRAVGKAVEIRRRVLGLLRQGQGDQALAACRMAPVGRMFEAVLAPVHGDPVKAERAAERRRMDALQGLRRNVWFLGTIGALAPFVGLFGTVVGIMESFRSIAIAGSGGFSVVAAGISEALIATGAGLMVAIYSVFAFNYFSTRINAIGYQWKVDLEDLSDLMSASASPRLASNPGKRREPALSTNGR